MEEAHLLPALVADLAPGNTIRIQVALQATEQAVESNLAGRRPIDLKAGFQRARKWKCWKSYGLLAEMVDASFLKLDDERLTRTWEENGFGNFYGSLGLHERTYFGEAWEIQGHS